MSKPLNTSPNSTCKRILPPLMLCQPETAPTQEAHEYTSWDEVAGYKLSEEEHREITQNLTAYFDFLSVLARKYGLLDKHKGAS